ncbi:MAG: TetR family transcriptional regulator [Candidatus Marinimicrobia bacterium]|nr:TetR family transcriptional regulator [Candidatus Neomarinimicrobiota bacterium]
MHKLTDKQQNIIQASIELISESGIQRFTIKNLANRIHVTDGAIYRHFTSKEEILHTILKLFQVESAIVLKQACNSTNLAMTDIENMFSHHLKYFAKHPAVSAVIFSEDIFQNSHILSQEVYKLLVSHEEALTCVLQRGIDQNEITVKIEIKELISILIGSIRYTVKKWRLNKYSYNLEKEGQTLLNSIKLLLRN